MLVHLAHAEAELSTPVTASQRAYAAEAVMAYAVTLLWTSTAEDGSPLDDTYGAEDYTFAALVSMSVDVLDFVVANWDDLSGMEAAQCGYDFLLTRNRSGAGFWDRGLGAAGDRLTAMAHPYGETYAYGGDDGSVYVQ